MKTQINEIKRMQVLAGIITENMSADDVDGWMRSYVDDITATEDLTPEYRNEFDIIWDKAVDMFKQEHSFEPSLDKEKFWYS